MKNHHQEPEEIFIKYIYNLKYLEKCWELGGILDCNKKGFWFHKSLRGELKILETLDKDESQLLGFLAKFSSRKK